MNDSISKSLVTQGRAQDSAVAGKIEANKVTDGLEVALKQIDECSKPWFVYLIECKNGSIYTGIAVDVVSRYQKHVAGKGARYTRANPPVRLLAVIRCNDHSEALKSEYRIKHLKRAEKKLLAREHQEHLPDLPS